MWIEFERLLNVHWIIIELLLDGFEYFNEFLEYTLSIQYILDS